MNLLNKLTVLLLLVGFYLPAYAAVDNVVFDTCSVFSEADKKAGNNKDGKKKGGEEEPECE